MGSPELSSAGGSTATPAWTPPDQEARTRIARDLDTSLLVEAGAGSGKTTAMVGRMVELIRTGRADIERIAAVTFTRKAAAELRERFQERLEHEYRLRAAEGDAAERGRFERALRDLERCSMGTIHSFCARLLRERPLDAGISPAFQELSGVEETRFRAECWTRFLERCARRRSPMLRRLAGVGVRASELRPLFEEIGDNPDVHYAAPIAPALAEADVRKVHGALGALLDHALTLLPDREPAGGWDPLQLRVRQLRFSRRVPGWDDTARFLEVLGDAAKKVDCKVTYWSPHPRDEVKALVARWEEFSAEGGDAERLLRAWEAYRYPIAIRFARCSAAYYRRERLRAGRLSFQDLLLLTAGLLRSNADVRAELGERYRYLLIDEFQDTDPIQAEVVFLLAGDGADAGDWTRAAPRPGALFVVGDPKQSIYRFRRADITVYNQVKRRFRDFGDVLHLTANFRSTAPVAAFVNRMFGEHFPADESEHQAAFSAMRVAPPRAPVPAEGVHTHLITPQPGTSHAAIMAPEAEAVAAYVAACIAPDGGRKPGDFLLLTRKRKELPAYARALERRGIPVQVSGAGVGVEEELRELILLLQALADPGDAVLTLAVLEGLFFGLPHDALVEHVEGGGAFGFTAPAHGVGRVATALGEIHDLWQLTRSAPADVAVPRIVDRLGLVPYAAAGELSSTRAGALHYALDAVRAAGVAGSSSLGEAIEALESALEQEVDAPLVPGETNAVRLMNVHKAKGLEAPVVILACPLPDREREPPRHVVRHADGSAVATVRVCAAGGFASRVLARPLDWDSHAAAERVYLAAEEMRLLYVAATRAAHQLVIARCGRTADTSVWRHYHPYLDDAELASELEVTVTAAEPRAALPPERVGEIAASVAALEARRASLSIPSYRAAPVTARVKHGASGASSAQFALRLEPEDREADRWGDEAGDEAGRAHAGAAPAGRGPEWGTAVHQALEAAAGGADGAVLRAACRSFLVEAERPCDDRGEPLEVEELLALVASVRGSSLWGRAMSAERRAVEVPFALTVSRNEAAALGVVDVEGASPGAFPGTPPLETITGTIDLAFREPDGWVIADFKSDVLGDADTARTRIALYRKQVDAYAACWTRISGEAVKERRLVFVADGREESW